MRSLIHIALLGSLLIVGLAIACTKDKGRVFKEPEVCAPSFSKDVQPFVSLKCAVAKCHVSGFPFGDFTSFGGLKAKIQSGDVATVLNNGLMPPASSPQLTNDELNTLKCWIDNGAQEN